MKPQISKSPQSRQVVGVGGANAGPAVEAHRAAPGLAHVIDRRPDEIADDIGRRSVSFQKVYIMCPQVSVPAITRPGKRAWSTA